MSRARVPLIILLTLIAVYIINCFTPLRLTNDTVRYIGIKEWIEAGKPAGHPAATEFLPYGYVWFLLLLGKLNMAYSVVIAFIQLLYLGGSIWFVKEIFGQNIKAWQLAALCLLSWACLKFVITPLSEMQFLFFSMGALYFFHRWREGGKIWMVAWALLFTAAAMLTRTIGFVLIMAFVLGLVKKNRVVLIGGAVVVLVGLFFARPAIESYMKYHGGYFQPLRDNPAGFFANNFKYHLIDWAALVLNAPAPRINLPGKELIYLVAGIISFGVLVYLVFKKSPPEVKAYVLIYSFIILNWPLFEPRLWVPILPLSIAVALQYRFTAFKIIYAVVGVIALGYYTYTSCNKKAFAIKQDAAIWRNEYETHFFGKPLSDTATVVRQPIVNMLKKYD